MKNFKENNEKFCWLILRASLGEFHVIAPELINFAEQENLKLHITFLTKKIEKQFFDNSLYKNLADQYFEVVERSDIISFLHQNKNNIKYLFRDISELNKYSIVRSLRILLPEAKLIIYPHAFAFYTSEELSNYQTLKIPSKSKFEDCVDAFIIFTEADKDYFSKRFPAEIITVYTPRGLRKEWLCKLREKISNTEIDAFREKYPKRILLTVRHPHKVYLSEKNYFELASEVIEVSEKFGYKLFLKPHPRQNIQECLNYCKTNNLQLWTKDTYTSGLFFNHVITFWSSASIDFAAFGIPSIEHFRYERYHNQLIKKDGKLSSLYVNMGLSLPSSNKAELEFAFKKIINDPQGLGGEQQQNLNKEYNRPLLNINNIKFKTPKKFTASSKLKHLIRLYYYILRNK